MNALVGTGKRKSSEKPVFIFIQCEPWLHLSVKINLDHRAVCILAKAITKLWERDK